MEHINTTLRTSTITIRLTESEKRAIERYARKSNKSISRFVIESSITAEPKIMKEIRPVISEIRKLSGVIRSFDKTLCENEQRTPVLDDIVDMQKNIFSMVQHIASDGGL